MMPQSDVEKHLKYLAQLKNERMNSAQLAIFEKTLKFGKEAPAQITIVNKRRKSSKDPTLHTEGRFKDDFPAIKDNYFATYNANHWQGYTICEGPDPLPKKKDQAILSFIENILNNDYYSEIDKLIVIGNPNDILTKYESVKAFADYFTTEASYGSYFLKPIKPNPDKSTKNIKHIRLLIKKNGKEINEIDLYQVLRVPATLADLNENDIKLLHEIARCDSAKIATHDATGLDYSAAFIYAFYLFKHFNAFICEDDKIYKKLSKVLNDLNNSRPGAIQDNNQFEFAVKLSFEIYQIHLNNIKTKYSNVDTKPLRSPTPPAHLFMTPSNNGQINGSRDSRIPKRSLSATHIHARFNLPVSSTKPFSSVAVDTRLTDFENNHISNVSPLPIPVVETIPAENSTRAQEISPMSQLRTSLPILIEPKSFKETDDISVSPDSVDSELNSPRLSDSLSKDGKVRLVCIIGSLDSKRAENEELRRLLLKQGFATFIIDVGTFEPKDVNYHIDVKTEQIVAAAGYDLETLRQLRNRPKTVNAVKAGLAKEIIELNNKYAFDAVIGMGGSNGTDIVTSAMQQLPETIIKVCISTVAGHETWEYTKGSGILLFNPITDIGGGVNSYIKQVIERAVGALAGMIRSPRTKIDHHEAPKKPTIVTSKFGVTTPAVDAAAEALQNQGYNVLHFHAVGTGGKTMEGLIRNGSVDGCLDITLPEITSLLDHGVWSAGEERLSAAVDMRIPQVLSLGALDMTMLNKEALNNPKHKNRLIYKCNPDVYAMRNGIEQYDHFAQFIVNKLQHAKAPAILLIPTKGLSAFDNKVFDEQSKTYKPLKLQDIDAPNDRTKDIIWHDDLANRFLFKRISCLAATHMRHVPVIELDCHINDLIFAKLAAKLMLLTLKIHQEYKDSYQLILIETCRLIKNKIKEINELNDFDFDINSVLSEASKMIDGQSSHIRTAKEKRLLLQSKNISQLALDNPPLLHVSSVYNIPGMTLFGDKKMENSSFEYNRRHSAPMVVDTNHDLIGIARIKSGSLIADIHKSKDAGTTESTTPVIGIHTPK